MSVIYISDNGQVQVRNSQVDNWYKTELSVNVNFRHPGVIFFLNFPFRQRKNCGGQGARRALDDNHDTGVDLPVPGPPV